MRRTVFVGAAIALVFLALSTPANAADDGGDSHFGGAASPNGDAFNLDALGNGGHPGTPASGASSGPDVPTEYLTAPLCIGSTTLWAATPLCDANEGMTQLCADGSEAEPPLWRRTQQADGTWSLWELIEDYHCAGDAALIAAIKHEWAQLKPEPSEINLQPDTGWVLATVPTVAMAGDDPRVHSATLLGAAVDIRATASGYRWNWGDGTHTSTADPGRPYPNATVTHTFPRASDGSTVSLTTTWTGEFRVNGGAWQAIDGTITSQSQPVELAIYDPRSQLVNCDLDGKCILAAR